MKQAKIVALILFTVLIAGGIAEQFYIKRTFAAAAEYTAYLDRTINAETIGSPRREIDGADIASAIERLNDFEKWWDERSKIIESLAHNRDIKNVAQEISRLIGLLEIQNAAEAQISLVTLKATLKNLEQMLSFKLEHII
ncbi:MAG: DUF4363 family protein [Clostridiales bacterium]|nr:DUF4363 family protein [Clostridiales bacterium]